MLLGIILANIFYCLLAAGIIFFHHSLTNLGKTFFAIEIVVVIAVIAIEWRVYQKHFMSAK
jgi:hypothetical protein